MKTRILSALLLACASDPPDAQWYKEGGTPEELDAARELCMKQQEQRKPRKKPEQPPPRPVPVAQPPPMQMPAVAMATAMPIACPMMHVPLVAVSPQPMRPLGLTPTAWPLLM